MGTVKYTGPVASFHCPTNAEIRSLKVHFSPKQEGSGDPSPENVREIVGWDGVKVYKSGKNLFDADTVYAAYKIGENSFEAMSNEIAPVHYYIPQELVGKQLTFSAYLDLVGLSAPTAFLCRVDVNGSKIAGNYIAANNEGFTSVTFTPTSTNDFIEFTWGSGKGLIKFKDFMLEIGSARTSYEPYQGSTTNYEFGVLGKNKVNIGTTTFTQYKKYVLDNPLPPGTYTLSTLVTSEDTDSTYSIILFEQAEENGNVVGYVSRDARASTRITTVKPCSTIYIYASTSYAKSADDECTWSDVQLELGSTATTYEPYDPKHTVYGGWVDLITGEVCEEWKTIIIDDTYNSYISGNSYRGINYTDMWFDAGSDNWGYSTNYTYNLNEKDTQCETFKLTSNAIWSNPDAYPWNYVLNSSNQIHCVFDNAVVGIMSDDTNDVAKTKIKTWVSEHPIKVAYRLSESKATTYYLAPTQLTTFLGQNNVWSNADYVEIEYDLHETQSILARKQFIIANQPHVATPAAAPLQSFTTDVPAPLKECKVHFKPVQDLHGYDRPWVGGAGKNLLNVENATPAVSSITLSEGTVTITAVGSGNGSKQWFDQVFPAGTYTMSAKYSGSVSGVRFLCTAALTNWIWNDYYNGYFSSTNNTITFTASETFSVGIVFLTLSDHVGESGTIYDIQLEQASTATSYEPYENICPIEGWDGIEVYRTGKNLFSLDVSYQDPSNTALQNTNDRIFTPYTYAYGASYSNWWQPSRVTMCNISTNELRLTTSTSDYGVGFAIPVKEGTTICLSYTNADNAGRSYFAFYDEDGKYIRGAQNQNGGSRSVPNKAVIGVVIFSSYNKAEAVFTDISVTYGNTVIPYEPYTGTTIPITFPATTNLFNEQWEQGNIEVGNNAGSSTCMRTNFINVNPSTSYYLYTPRENNVFVFEYLEDGTYANKVNSVLTSHTFTTGSTTTKIRIVDRNSGTETVNTGINYPATNTYYEPYGTIYGGYVDLVTGEVWKTWDTVKIADLQWNNYSQKIRYYSNLPQRKLNTYIYTDTLTPRINGNFIQAPVGEITYQGEGSVGQYTYIFTTLPEAMEYTEANTWIKNTYSNATITYELETPILVATLTPIQLKTLRGANNIWSNTNDNITLSYWTH